MNLSTSKLSHAVIAGASLLFVSFTSLADRTVIDQLGRQVAIPDRVNRVVVLQHQTLNLLVPEMISQIEKAGIPVVAISLRRDAQSEKGKLNPQMNDEEQAYNLGLQEGIRLIAKVVNRESQGEALIDYAFKQRETVGAFIWRTPI